MVTGSNRKSNKESNLSRSWGKFVMVVLAIIFQLGLFSIQSARADDAEPALSQKIAVGALALVGQPIYGAYKLIVAWGGSLAYVFTLHSLEDEEAAQKILDASWAGPWSIPELFEKSEMEKSRN